MGFFRFFLGFKINHEDYEKKLRKNMETKAK